MDIRAVILVEAPAPESTQQFAGVALPFLDVLGKSVLQHVISRLERFGVKAVSVVTETEPPRTLSDATGSEQINWRIAVGAHFWRAAEAAFCDQAQAGADLILVMRMGAYTEVDVEELIQFHLDRASRITCVLDSDGNPLDIFVVSGSRRNDAAYLLRHELRAVRVPCDDFHYRGYVNPLLTPTDVRRMALDGFAGLCEIKPNGREIKPGVWVAEGASIHHRSRLLAPCFVGERARIRSKAVLTRGSVIEHDAIVDCGTVIDNSSVLAMSIIGAGLDLTQSVAGYKHIWSIKRDLSTEITDRQLVSVIRGSRHGLLYGATRLAASMPKLIWRSLAGHDEKTVPAQLRHSNPPHPPEVLPEEHVAASDLLPARRYGNE